MDISIVAAGFQSYDFSRLKEKVPSVVATVSLKAGIGVTFS
jgi:hypothetical protein